MPDLNHQCGFDTGVFDGCLAYPTSMKKAAPNGIDRPGPDAPSAHRRPGYPLKGCVPAEPYSVSPGIWSLRESSMMLQPPSDTGAMP